MRGDESDDEPGALRIDFPGDAGDAGGEPLEHVSWEEWFRRFDEDELCFLYQEERATGEASTFFKVIDP